MDFLLLYLTLVFALFSFLCSTYTTLRTLLPLLPGHPLNRRHAGAAVTPYDAPTPPSEGRPRLKSAQRFASYLACVDIFAAIVLIWEVATAFSAEEQLGASKTAAARVYLATTARPTLLAVVAVLSYVNVVQGRQIALGRLDWIVWFPALVIYAVGAGLASIARVDSPNVWIGLAAWLSVVTVVVTGCFGRLLVAILRVRRIAHREQALSRFASEQEKVISTGDMPYPALPAWGHKFSGLSSSFVGQIGRSTSTVNLPAAHHHVVPFTSDTRSAVSYAPSRPSADEPGDYDPRDDFRSPTPGSSRFLLDRSATSTPAGLSPFDLQSEHDAHEVLGDSSQQEPQHESRPSLSSLTSRASTYLAPGGFIGSSAVRTAIGNSLVKEAWGNQTPPGTGHSPKVELSQREARAALIRIGGHLASCLLGYALISPFVFTRLAHPAASAPLALSILLVLGVCQPGLVLAAQSWTSEGFWYRSPKPPVLTSSSALAFEQFQGVQVIDNKAEPEMQERSYSRASTMRTWKTSVPGIQPENEDCSPTVKGRVGRALSMIQLHPKLQVLPNEPVVEPTATQSGFIKSATTNGHARPRSLKLSKATVTSVGEFGKTRPRAGSATSRKTVGGFEHHARRVSAPVHPHDTVIAMSLLKSRKQNLRPPSQDKVPFGFDRSRSRSPTPSPTPSSSYYPATTPTTDLAFIATEFALSPTASSFPSTTPAPTSTRATTPVLPIQHYDTDYLTAHVLPHLVPSTKLSDKVRVAPEGVRLPRRRSSLDSHVYPPAKAATLPSRSSAAGQQPQSQSLPARRPRNFRNLSLPLFTLTPDPSTSHNEPYLVIDKPSRSPSLVDEPQSALVGLRKIVQDSADEAAKEAADAAARPADESYGDGWDVVEASSPVSSPQEGQREEARPSQTHRRRSTRTLLDISFEWENEDASEVLDAGALADEEDGEEEEDDEAGDAALAAHRRTRRAVLPLSPPTTFFPLHQSSPVARSPADGGDGSVVLRGSQAFSSSEEEDARTGTIHCASVRPVSRQSDVSSAAESPSLALRPTHLPVSSISSLRSPTAASSLTAPGFRNLMERRSWHDDSGASSDDATRQQQQQQQRRPLPTPPVQVGHRPLSLLGQRDLNTSHSLSHYSQSSFSSYSCPSGSDSDRPAALEATKVDRHASALAARERAQKRRSRSGMPLRPLPDVPAPIEEADDEDAKSRKSGTPIPRARRTQPGRASPAVPLPPLPLSMTTTAPRAEQQPTKTPPGVTTRSKARRQQQQRDESASSAAVNDENAVPSPAGFSYSPVKPLNIRRPAGSSAMRSMR
ncbi:hypothetical protein JCM8097_006361 [Rhodosporidiobolus ruineniae]